MSQTIAISERKLVHYVLFTAHSHVTYLSLSWLVRRPDISFQNSHPLSHRWLSSVKKLKRQEAVSKVGLRFGYMSSAGQCGPQTREVVPQHHPIERSLAASSYSWLQSQEWPLSITGCGPKINKEDRLKYGLTCFVTISNLMYIVFWEIASQNYLLIYVHSVHWYDLWRLLASHGLGRVCRDSTEGKALVLQLLIWVWSLPLHMVSLSLSGVIRVQR